MSRVQIVMFASAVTLLLAVLNLVRRRRLREEYSWLWLLASLVFLSLTISSVVYGWVVWLIGASNAALAFAFLGLYFLTLICIQFSVQLSQLVTKSKNLAQEIAILDGEIRDLQKAADVAMPSAGGELQKPVRAAADGVRAAAGNGREPGSNGWEPAKSSLSGRVQPARDQALSDVKLSNNPVTELPLPGLMPPSSSGHQASGYEDHAERSID